MWKERTAASSPTGLDMVLPFPWIAFQFMLTLPVE
jgi:hypothetical protein